MPYAWLTLADIRAIHLQQIAKYGGAGDGVRDGGLIESALARPINAYNYGTDDLFELAALYCSGITRNHPFVDGNKRTAWVAMRLFLRLNGYKTPIDDDANTLQMMRFAAGHVSDEAMAAWLRERCVAV